MTEFRDDASPKMLDILRNIEQFRNTVSWVNLARTLLLIDYRFDAIDIQN